MNRFVPYCSSDVWSGNKAASKSKAAKETGIFSEIIIVRLLTIFVSKIYYLFHHRICFHGISNHSGSDQRSCPKRTETSQSCDVGRNQVRSLAMLPIVLVWAKILMTLVYIYFLHVSQMMGCIYHKREIT